MESRRRTAKHLLAGGVLKVIQSAQCLLARLGAKKIQHALNRILGKVSWQHFNGLEVTGLVAKRFLGLPYAHGFRTFASCPTELLPGWRRRPAIIPARCSIGPGLMAFLWLGHKPSHADRSLFLSRQAPGWMRLDAGQASAKLAFLARLCATRGTADKQCWFLLGFHDHRMPDC
jgi:hypothetical protein